MTSVCIPAYNEENTIATLLQVLEHTDVEEVLVCANGCTDATADVAAEFPHVRVIEEDHASKTHAWNRLVSEAVGERLVFFDADIRPDPDCVDGLVDTLDTHSLAGARIQWVSRDDTWQNRLAAYISNPMADDTILGGAYGLYREDVILRMNRAGYRYMPPVVADDGFIASLYKEHEMRICDAVAYHPAPGLHEYAVVQARRNLGVQELERYPGLHSRSHGVQKVWRKLRKGGARGVLRYAARTIYNRILQEEMQEKRAMVAADLAAGENILATSARACRNI